MNAETYFDQHQDELNLYTNAITKAHGAHHPEVFDVRKLFQEIQEKAQKKQWNFVPEFTKLRQVTHSYQVPDDVCQTFEKTYHMLADFDQIVMAATD